MEIYNNQTKKGSGTSVSKSRALLQTEKVRYLSQNIYSQHLSLYHFRHRAVNLFLNEYSETWLSQIRLSNMERLCERLLVRMCAIFQHNYYLLNNFKYRIKKTMKTLLFLVFKSVVVTHLVYCSQHSKH